MSKLISLAQFSKDFRKLSLSDVSVIVNEEKVPLGFVFGRDSFISFLESLDNQFEKNVKNEKVAFNNSAGKLIDLIEEKLPINPKFVEDLKSSIKKTKKSELISLEEIERSLNN